MHRIAKSVLVALFAVMCMGALAATSASAVEPLFINESGKALSFSGTSGVSTLRGGNGRVEGIITCEKDAVQGFALDKSPLARELHIEFSGNCEQTVGTTKGKCTEPIKPELSYGELGLLGPHVYLLVAPEKGTKFVSVECRGFLNTEVEGAVIGEFKLNGRDGNLQYGVLRKLFLLLFKAEGGNKVKQDQEEIELLGTLMKGVKLKVTGPFGENASEETVELLHLDGNGRIDP